MLQELVVHTCAVLIGERGRWNLRMNPQSNDGEEIVV